MATLQKGTTFAGNDEVTAEKLNDLVDEATISGIVNADIAAGAAIAHTKLASITAGRVLMGNSSNVPTATVVSGDVTISNSGVTAIAAGAIATAEIADDAVTSAKIADGTIDNSNVNASAAIAGTKVSPNFGSQNIETTGTLAAKAGSVISGASADAALRVTQTGSGNALLIEDSTNPDGTPFVVDSLGNIIAGHTASLSAYGTNASAIQAHGISNPRAAAGITHWGGTATSTPAFVLSKSKSGTIGTNGVVASADSLGHLYFYGDDGAKFVEAARITAQVDGTPGTDDMPGRLVFSTTADGASSVTERLRITAAGVLEVADAGNISVGTTTGTKIGTATTQKLGFYNATPIVQPAAAAQAAVATTGATSSTPFGYTEAQANAIVALVNEMRRVLVNLGLMKGAA